MRGIYRVLSSGGRWKSVKEVVNGACTRCKRECEVRHEPRVAIYSRAQRWNSETCCCAFTFKIICCQIMICKFFYLFICQNKVLQICQKRAHWIIRNNDVHIHLVHHWFRGIFCLGWWLLSASVGQPKTILSMYICKCSAGWLNKPKYCSS